MAMRLVFFLLVLALPGLTERSWAAQNRPATTAELALYKGPDREKLLLEGAQKEGQVTLYTSNTWIGGPVAQAFGKKYPAIKISVWRSDSISLMKRLTEEAAAGRAIADVAETSPEYMTVLQRHSLIQEHYSPEVGAYGLDAKVSGKNGGVYSWVDREIYISFGFNTSLLPPAEAPKTTRDLLEPRFKGKMSIAGTTTGVQWVGAVLEAFGQESLEKLSGQDINVQNMSGAALAELIAAGEVPMSPTIFNSNIFTAKQKGAPVAWRGLDPVVAAVGTSALLVNTTHPCAALLLLDFLHSKEGQETALKGGLSSARNDIGSLEQKFKKVYLESKYPPEEYEKKFNGWQQLMRRLFIRQR